MKKRRELDALVGNGSKMSRGRNPKKVQELLLENMSDSSDVEEFTLQSPVGKTIVRKRGFMHFCNSCLTVCSFFVLLSCVIAIVGLIFVYNDLKSEREKDQKSYATYSKQLQDLLPLQATVDQINKSVIDLKAQLPDLMEKMKTNQADIVNLKQEVANMGNKYRNLLPIVNNLIKNQSSVEAGATLKGVIDQLQNRTIMLENRLSLLELRPAGPSTTIPSVDMHTIVQQAVASVTEELKNYTIADVDTKLKEIDSRISSLETQTFPQQVNTIPSHVGDGLISVKEFMGTASNNFVLMNNSIQIMNQSLLTVTNSIKDHDERIGSVEESTKQLTEDQDKLKSKLESIETNISRKLVVAANHVNENIEINNKKQDADGNMENTVPTKQSVIVGETQILDATPSSTTKLSDKIIAEEVYKVLEDEKNSIGDINDMSNTGLQLNDRDNLQQTTQSSPENTENILKNISEGHQDSERET